jgi:hypothetical protein
MRQGQSSVEVALATLLLVVVVAAGWAAASAALIDAEVTVATVAGTQAAYRGRDGHLAALAAVPPWVRTAVALELNRRARGADAAR